MSASSLAASMTVAKTYFLLLILVHSARHSFFLVQHPRWFVDNAFYSFFSFYVRVALVYDGLRFIDYFLRIVSQSI